MQGLTLSEFKKATGYDCSKKHHESYAAAEEEATRMAFKMGVSRAWIRPYRCKKGCDAWHIGHIHKSLKQISLRRHRAKVVSA